MCRTLDLDVDRVPPAFPTYGRREEGGLVAKPGAPRAPRTPGAGADCVELAGEDILVAEPVLQRERHSQQPGPGSSSSTSRAIAAGAL